MVHCSQAGCHASVEVASCAFSSYLLIPETRVEGGGLQMHKFGGGLLRLMSRDSGGRGRPLNDLLNPSAQEGSRV